MTDILVNLAHNGSLAFAFNLFFIIAPAFYAVFRFSRAIGKNIEHRCTILARDGKPLNCRSRGKIHCTSLSEQLLHNCQHRIVYMVAIIFCIALVSMMARYVFEFWVRSFGLSMVDAALTMTFGMSFYALGYFVPGHLEEEEGGRFPY